MTTYSLRTNDLGSDASDDVTTIDAVLEQIGVGRFQWQMLLVNGLTWAADAMEVLLVGFILPSLIGQWHLSNQQGALIGTATFAGMFIGAWGYGILGDRIGRRKVFLMTVIQTALFGTLAAFSTGLSMMLVLRFLTGTALGGTLPVDYALLAEYLPTKERGRFLVYLESFWALGTVIVALLAWAFIPRDPVNGWRYVVGAGALLGLLGLWIRLHIPESPRFLLLHGREDEARAALQQAARVNGRDLVVGRLKNAGSTSAGSFSSLWQPRLLRRTLLLSLMWFTLSIGYYGIFTWLPSFFRVQKIQLIPVYKYSLLLALAQIPGYASAAYLVQRWGRKQTLALYLFASAVFSYFFTRAIGGAAIVQSGMLLSFSLLGAWGALYALTPELYPTEVRSTGMGWASAMARVAAILGPVIGGYLLDHKLPLTLSVTLYAALFVVGGIATLFVGRDTRDVPLEDVTKQAMPVGGVTAFPEAGR
ncbi:MAG: MFS transporter [Herpetosiphon sp.]